MNYRLMVIAGILLGCVACKSPDMALSDGLNQQTEAMPVSGKNGFSFNQRIAFGAFKTSRVKRGWTRSYHIPFFLHFQGARQRLSFTQYLPDSSFAEVAAVSRFKNTELPLLRDFFRISVDYEDSFAGTILPQADSTQAWEFLLHQPEGALIRKVGGFARNGTESPIEIKPVYRYNKPGAWAVPGVLGYEFIQDNRCLGGVEWMNNGKVWIRPGLDAHKQMVVAALSTALLLYENVSNDVSEQDIIWGVF